MTIEEMEEAVAAAMGLSDEVRSVLHGEGPRSQFDYELAWVRTYLKKSRCY
jgi:restriction system protein